MLLLKMKAKNLLHNGNYLYEVLRPVLPIQSINVRARDIDTADDYENAVNWFLKGMKEWGKEWKIEWIFGRTCIRAHKNPFMQV